MEPELAIDASREAIRTCLIVGGPVLAACLIVGLLMGLAQAMSHIQDQALATVPKILTIFALVAVALPWLSDQMIDFAKDQFSRPYMGEVAAAWQEESESESPTSMPSPLPNQHENRQVYYPKIDTASFSRGPLVRQASHVERFSLPKQKSLNQKSLNDSPGGESSTSPESGQPAASPNPFSLPSYRFSSRNADDLEG